MNQDPSSLTEAEDQSQEQLNHRYRIDPEVQEQQGRSFLFMVQQRMGAESASRAPSGASRNLSEQRETQAPEEEPETGRVRFRRQRTGGGNEQASLIKEYRANLPSYNDPRLPVKEILFRLLLAGGNEPKSVSQLHDEMRDWVGIGDSRALSPAALVRLLEHDDYYGFARVDEG